MDSKTRKKGQIIHGQTREIIDRISKFMKKEAEDGIQIPIQSHRVRTMAATGISKNTLLKISHEGRAVASAEGPATFSTPNKRKRQKKFHLTAEVAMEIKNVVYDFYIAEKKSPSLKVILKKLREKQTNYAGSVETLNNLAKSIGFRWYKSQDNRSIILEKSEIRLKRIQYLKQLQQYRKEGRTFIFMGQTNIRYSSNAQLCSWTDNSDRQTKKSASKEKIIIVRHAGGEQGFVSNGIEIFQPSGSAKTDPAHDVTNFMCWVETQLLPALPKNTVLILDSTSCHNATIEPNVTSNTRKADMVKWLQTRNIEFDDNLTKPELFKIITRNKSKYPPVYKLDSLLEVHGHKVLRLPPNHPDFNPIETIWILIKNWVASHNIQFMTVVEAESLTRQICSELSVAEWTNAIKRVEEYQSNLIEREHLFDISTDSLNFSLNNPESSDSESDDDDDSEFSSNSD